MPFEIEQAITVVVVPIKTERASGREKAKASTVAEVIKALGKPRRNRFRLARELVKDGIEYGQRFGPDGRGSVVEHWKFKDFPGLLVVIIDDRVDRVTTYYK